MKDVDEIKKHKFFEGIDWKELQKRNVETPFKPTLTGPHDLRYIDEAFKSEPPIDSMPDKSMNSAQKAANKFPDFTYTDPKAKLDS